MTVTELPAIAAPLPGAAIAAPLPDAALGSAGDDTPLSGAPARDGSAPIGFGALLDAMSAGGAQLERAEGAENAFISGTGSLQDMVFERAKADSLVSVAAAASSRMAQSLNTLAQMQL